MRRDKKDALTREIWRERFRGIKRWHLIGAFAFVGALAFAFDPPVVAGHQSGVVLRERHAQTDDRGAVPYLVVEVESGRIVSVRKLGSLSVGEEVCVLISRGALFWRITASLAAQVNCSESGQPE
jgi:hypothetical protein